MQHKKGWPNIDEEEKEEGMGTFYTYLDLLRCHLLLVVHHVASAVSLLLRLELLIRCRRETSLGKGQEHLGGGVH